MDITIGNNFWWDLPEVGRIKRKIIGFDNQNVIEEMFLFPDNKGNLIQGNLIRFINEDSDKKSKWHLFIYDPLDSRRQLDFGILEGNPSTSEILKILYDSLYVDD